MITWMALACITSFWAAEVAASCSHIEPTGSVDIYPSGSVVPENLLRMYIYFPRKMRTEDSLSHIHLLDAKGERLDGVFLAPKYELWSPDHRRLTLLLDPGRVKSGLAAHENLGRALIPGQDFTLMIMESLVDADGCALGKQTKHRFRVDRSDSEPPDPESWFLNVPTVGRDDPLVVDLGSAHDHLSLAYGLRVVDSDGEIVPGALNLEDAESVWVFRPAQTWREASYTVTIDSGFEDLAGNRPGVLFDQPIAEQPKEWSNRLPFRPARAGN